MLDRSAGAAQKRENKSTYYSWLAMKTRCYNKNREDWPRYGGRGISVCDRWRDSFENFFADMGPRPTGMTIDRYPDNDGNYEPGNCRWATKSQQTSNSSHAVKVTIDGVTDTIKGWAIRIGMPYGNLRTRLKNQKRTAEETIRDAIEHPVLKSRKMPKGSWAKDGDDSGFIGKKFHRLTVIGRHSITQLGRRFLCSCDCGNEKVTQLGSLINGECKSCGCLTKEMNSSRMFAYNAGRRASHG